MSILPRLSQLVRNRFDRYDNRRTTIHDRRRPVRAAAAEALEGRTYFGYGYNRGDQVPPTGCPGGGAVVAPTPNSGTGSCCDQNSQGPVRYFTGTPKVESVDLMSDAFGTPWGQVRSWSGLNESSQNGNGWSVTSLPYLALKMNQSPGGHRAIVTLVEGGQASREFAATSDTGDGFVARYADQSTLTYVAPTTDGSGNRLPGEFQLVDPAGNLTTFYDLPRDTYTDGNPGPLVPAEAHGTLNSSIGYTQEVTRQWFDETTGARTSGTSTGTYSPYRFGAFKGFVAASGNLTVTTTYDSSGNLTDVLRTDGSGKYEKFHYTYTTVTNTLGGSASLLSKVEMQHGTPAGGWTTDRSVEYAYYTGTVGDDTDKYGRLGDLKLVTVKDAGGGTVDQKYYRYTKLYGQVQNTGGYSTRGPTNDPMTTGGTDNGFTSQTGDTTVRSGLEAVFDGASFSRLAANRGAVSAFQDDADADVNPYANYVFTYGRVDPGDATYPDYWGFDTRYRVTFETAAAEGCSSCSGGMGTYKFVYERRQQYDNYITVSGGAYSTTFQTNKWFSRVTEYLPDTTDGDWTDNDREIVYLNELGEVILRVQVDQHGTSGTGDDEQALTYNRYDSRGRLTDVVHPNALTGYDGNWDDLVRFADNGSGYIADTGLIEHYEYATSTSIGISASTAGDVNGYLKSYSVANGYDALHGYVYVPVTSWQYYKHSYFGTWSVYPVASETQHWDVDRDNTDDAVQTTYAYTWREDGGSNETNQIESATTTRPTVASARNGPGSAASSVTYFDLDGRPTWTRDEDGVVGYTEYDPVGVTGAGAVTKRIVDVVYASLTTDEKTSFDATGWSHPSGGLHLTTAYGIDTLGRTTKVTDPNGNVTYTVYDDVNHTTLMFPGWDATAHTTTGPIVVSREYRPAASASSGQRTVYTETLTTNAAPSYGGSSGSYYPTGTAVAIDEGNILSLSRSLTNNAGQAVESDAYYSLSGVTYAQATAQLGSAGNDSSTNNYHATVTAYDARGRVKRVLNPAGTITRYLYDMRGNQTEVWVGTYDTPMSGYWSPSNTSGTDLTKVSETEYDNGGMADGNATKVIRYTGSGTRETWNYYDWRDRLVATKAGAQTSESGTTIVQRVISYTTYDNAGHPVAVAAYDGDGVSVGTTGGVPDAPSSSYRRGLTETRYDDWGRAYETRVFSVDQSTGTPSSDSLRTDVWYDKRGNVIKESDPGGLVTKTQYDGAGRVIKTFASDGGGDAAPGATNNWANAADATLSGDKVLTQTAYTYDANGNVIFTTTKDRFHDATQTGELGDTSSTTPTAKARVSYVASYYDKADRPTATVNVGTNGGSAYTRPSPNPDARDKDHLVTSYIYDDAGRTYRVTDPRGVEGRTTYDLLGRVKTTVAGYDDGTPSAANDQTTLYTYDGLGHVLTQTAHLTSSDQVTKYVYGVRTASQTVDGITYATTSNINSNDLLQAVRYPDKSTGAAGTGAGDLRVYAYNALGDVKTLIQQSGTVHAYTFDVLGRPLADAVTTVGSGIDGAVRRLETAYDTAGRAYLFTSYDAASGGSVVNQVQRDFNGLGQLTSEYQNHTGSVDAYSPRVQYAYTEMASSANHSRLKSITYPDGRVVRYEYGSGLDNSISRVSYLADDSGGSVGTHLEEYSYLGLGTIVRRAHPEPGVDLTYIMRSGETNGDAGSSDPYTGLDRFGRVIDQRWVNAGTGTATDRFQYGYDRDGNVLYKDNVLQSGLSELYHANGAASGDNNSAYDKLGRMTAFRRGTLSASGNNSSGSFPNTTGLDRVTAAALNQDVAGSAETWTLDALGNWTSSTSTVGNGSTEPTSSALSRTHDGRNEVTNVNGNTVSYDADGNVTYDDRGQSFTYDAWGRAVSGSATGSHSLAYKYDALSRRIHTDDDYYYPGSGTQRYEQDHDLYYSAAWQVVQDDSFLQGWDSDYGPDPLCCYTSADEYVWGQGYVDDLVLRDRSGSPLTPSTGRLYAEQDANYNVTSLINAGGAVAERYAYDPYGNVTVLNGGSADPDGGYDPEWSVDATPDDGLEWVYLHQGGRVDPSSGLYSFRHRDYSPSLGRWMQADPAGYVDGSNLYEDVKSNPIRFDDPSGLRIFVYPSKQTPVAGNVVAGAFQQIISVQCAKIWATPKYRGGKLFRWELDWKEQPQPSSGCKCSKCWKRLKDALYNSKSIDIYLSNVSQGTYDTDGNTIKFPKNLASAGGGYTDFITSYNIEQYLADDHPAISAQASVDYAQIISNPASGKVIGTDGVTMVDSNFPITLAHEVLGHGLPIITGNTIDGSHGLANKRNNPNYDGPLWVENELRDCWNKVNPNNQLPLRSWTIFNH